MSRVIYPHEKLSILDGETDWTINNELQVWS